MSTSERDRYIIEGKINQHANDIVEQVVASLNLARETVREVAIEYAVRTGLDNEKAVEMARDLIEHVEWGVRCHFIEYQRDRV